MPSEDNKMHRFLILSALVLSTTLIGPGVAQAAGGNDKRYYDQGGKDYHVWNDNEDKAYRTYLTEQHREYRKFNTVKRPEQEQYFKWRHEHPDKALVKVEIK